jgi:hypothetical protein
MVTVLVGFGGWLLALGVYTLLPLLTGPATRRAVGQAAERFLEWSADRNTRARRGDDDEDDLYLEQVRLMRRRQQLCADLRRVEHLVKTDSYMSATRQLGNRLAYEQLRDELRRTPEVFLAGYQSQPITLPDDSTGQSRSWGLLPAQPRTVEILEIGWDRRRR